MARILAFVYGVVVYAFFFVTFVYAIGFVGNLVVPKSIDVGGPSSPLGEALLINTLLLALFGIQHSVMARLEFKKYWTKIVPPPVERTTYVLLATAILALLMWQWRPIFTIVWNVENTFGQALLWFLFVVGWGLVFLATFLINHFDLFGLRQVWFYLRGQEYRHLEFRTTAIYKYVRHPLLLGFVIAFWATPTMTLGHLLFSIVTTVYMLVAIQLEERDLVKIHGPIYKRYQEEVPMLIPMRRATDLTGEMEAERPAPPK